MSPENEPKHDWLSVLVLILLLIVYLLAFCPVLIDWGWLNG